MTHVDVTVPDGLLAALRKAPHEVADELRLAATIHWYQQGQISMARAAETAGMTHWVTPDEERVAFEYFKRHQDHTYSMVDSLSFIVMEKLGIHEALAVDSDFTHRFIARPGPLRG